MNFRLPHDLSLVKRLLTALVCAPVILWLFLARGIPLYIFLAALTVLGQWELYGMFGSRLGFPHKVISFIAGLLIVTDAFITQSAYFFSILAGVMIASFFIEVIAGKNDRLDCITLSLFSAVYPAVCIAFLFKIDQYPSLIFGAYLRYFLVFILLVIWIFDTASYFAGRAFGKHPFFPEISPKKTVEGFIGGIAAVIVAGVTAGLWIDRFLLGHFFVLSLLIALSGQIGDLAESIVKRELNAKDSSNIIPGHGGILDRFDSLFFAAPAVYCYLVICQWLTGMFM